ncbi:MAG: hypothetical protein ABIP06_13230 [Pyrinomonadaceae bacterium]
MLKKLLFVFFVLSAVSAFAQDVQTTPQPTPQPTPPTLDTILNKAAEQSENYRETFRDLLAVETKSFESYDKNGGIDESSEVESNFFVYQSSKDGKTSTELRNVIKVDGKLVPDSQARADRFLGELQKTKTVEKELEKIQDESLRYDENFVIYGMTLYQAIPLFQDIRSFFEFKLAGTENYQGRDVYVVSYRQTRKSPSITIDEKKSKVPGIKVDFELNLPGSLKKTEKFLQGKLLIDAETFQLLREEREIAVQMPTPLVAQKTVFEYVPSKYEIYVPKRITFTDYNFKKGSNKNNFTTSRAAQITFNYSEFKRTNVDIEILDDDGSQ